MRTYHEELTLCWRVWVIGPITKYFMGNLNKTENLYIVSHLAFQCIFILLIWCKFHLYVQDFVQCHIEFSNLKNNMWIVHRCLLKMSLFKVYSVLVVNVKNMQCQIGWRTIPKKLSNSLKCNVRTKNFVHLVHDEMNLIVQKLIEFLDWVNYLWH